MYNDESDKKEHKHIAIMALEIPDTKDQMCEQVRKLVFNLYDSIDFEAPVAPVLGFLLSPKGPLHYLTHKLHDKHGWDIGPTAAQMCAVVGFAAKEKESKWLHRQLPNLDLDNPTESDIDFLNAHIKQISFCTLCNLHDDAGLGCSCSLCIAVHVATKLLDKATDLMPIMEELSAIKREDAQKDKCCYTLLEQMAEEQGWEQNVTGHQKFKTTTNSLLGIGKKKRFEL